MGNAPSASLHTIHNWEEQSVQDLGLQMGLLLLRGISTGWRNELTRNSTCLTKGDTKFCITHQSRLGLTIWKAARKRRTYITPAGQVEHEQAMFPWTNPGLKCEKWSQQVEGGNLPSLLSSCEITSRVLDPFLGSPVRDRHGSTEANALKLTKMSQGLEQLTKWEPEKARTVWPWAQKVWQGSHQCS